MILEFQPHRKIHISKKQYFFVPVLYLYTISWNIAYVAALKLDHFAKTDFHIYDHESFIF